MRDFVLSIAWYLFHLFCSGWLQDWVHARACVPEGEMQKFIGQYEADAAKGKSKPETWLGDTLPSGKVLRRRSRELAANKKVYDRCMWVFRLAELPASLFFLRCLLAITEFWGFGPVPGWLYGTMVVYDLVLLLLGIRWRRKS